MPVETLTVGDLPSLVPRVSPVNPQLLDDYPMPWLLNRTFLTNNRHPLKVNFFKLYKNSGLFRKMIHANQQNHVITYYPADTKLFEVAVYFCHLENYHLTEENILLCLKAASDYEISTLLQHCCTFIQEHLTPANVWSCHRLAVDLRLSELRNSLLEDYLAQNILACCQEQGFQQLSVEELAVLLQRDDLNVRKEKSVLALLLLWALAGGQWQTRAPQLNRLVHTVRCSLLTVEQVDSFPKRIFQECEALSLLRTCVLSQDDHLMPQQKKRSNAWLHNLLSASPSQPRLPHEAILVFGGYEHHRISQRCSLYEPRAQRWFTFTTSSKPQHPLVLPQPLMSFGIAISYSRAVVYLVGGEERQNHASQKLQVLHLRERRWELQSPMYEERRDLAVVIIDDEFLFALGGDNNRQVLQTVEKYTPTTRQWTRVQPMLLRRSGLAAAAIGHKVFAFGGYTMVPMDELTNSCEVYDVDTNQWSLIAAMRDLRYYIQAVVAPLSGYIYILGGGDEMFWSTVERYDPQKNHWTVMPPMGTQRADFAACLLEGEIFCMGGGNDTSSTWDMESWGVERSHLLAEQRSWQRSVPMPVRVWGHRCVCIRGAQLIASLLESRIEERHLSRAVLRNMFAEQDEPDDEDEAVKLPVCPETSLVNLEGGDSMHQMSLSQPLEREISPSAMEVEIILEPELAIQEVGDSRQP